MVRVVPVQTLASLCLSVNCLLITIEETLDGFQRDTLCLWQLEVEVDEPQDSYAAVQEVRPRHVHPRHDVTEGLDSCEHEEEPNGSGYSTGWTSNPEHSGYCKCSRKIK